jgi:hypothetical protein
MGCMNERVKFKEGKMPGNLDGLGHPRNRKTGQRDIIKGQECIKFVSNGELKENEYMPSAQSPEVPRSKPRGSEVKTQRFRSLEASSHTDRRTQRFRENSRRFRGL